MADGNEANDRPRGQTKKMLRAEAEQARERLSLAVRSAHIGIWDWDLIADQVYFSPEWKAQLGYADDELSNDYHEWESRLHPEERERVLEKLRAYRAGETDEYALEFRLRHKDGSYRWIACRAEILSDEEGRPARMTGCHVDITERKEAEDELYESRQRLELALEGGGLGMWDWNIRTGEVAFSEYWARMFGYRMDEVEPTVDFFLRHVHPDDLEQVRSRLTEHVEARQAMYESEHRMRTKSGRWIWTLDRGRVIEHDGEGNPTRAIGLIVDVTEMRKARERLHSLNRHLRMLSEANQQLVRAKSEEELLREICRVVVVFGGYRMAWAGMKENGPDKRIVPAGHSGFADGYLDTLQLTWADTDLGRGPAGTAIRERRTVAVNDIAQDSSFEPWKDAALNMGYASAVALPLFDEDKAFGVFVIYSHAIGAFTDNELPVLEELASDLAYGIGAQRAETAQQEAERSLATSEKRWHSLADHAPDMILTMDGQRRIQYVNRPPIGIPLEEALGRDVLEYVLPEYRERLAKILEEVMNTREFRSLELRGAGDNGRTAWYSVRLAPLETESNVEAIAIVRNIDERKRAEEELRSVNKQLSDAVHELEETQKQVIRQERLLALGEMASGIAHDFNNHLQMMLGFTDLLMNDPDRLSDHDKAMNRLEQIREAGIHAAEVVDRLRIFYRPSSEGDYLDEIDLNAKAERVLALSEPKWKSEAQAANREIRFEKELGAIPSVRGNREELQEALLALVLNALDAMPAGGTIRIRTFAEEDSVVFEISDTGVGMDEDATERCLEPFFTTKGPQGTGLGLSVTHGIVKRHGGSMDIASEIGKGTTVTLRIPLDASDRSEPETQAVPTGKGASLRILIVDDEEHIRFVLSKNLQSRGHATEAASGAQEALEILRDAEFDLLITDRAMPGLSGDDLALKAKEAYPDMAVFMLTGFGDIIKAKGEALPGVDKLLAKPIVLEDLCRAVAELPTGNEQA